jgi:hypothetical protein
VPSTVSLIAALVAAISGYTVVRTGRSMMGAGVDIQDGGTWTALLILEITVNFAAVGVAIS